MKVYLGGTEEMGRQKLLRNHDLEAEASGPCTVERCTPSWHSTQLPSTPSRRLLANLFDQEAIGMKSMDTLYIFSLRLRDPDPDI